MSITANATSNQSITGWRIYVDGTTVYSAGAAKRINTSLPLEAGTHTIVVRAWAKNGSYGSATLTETVASQPNVTPIAITTSSLPSGVVGTVYNARLTASGGTPPYVWNLVEGTLPSGLTLSSTGYVTGTPSAAGTSGFMVQVKDSAASPQAASSTDNITIASVSGGITPPAQAAGYTLKLGDDFNTLSLGPKGGAYTWYDMSAVANSVSVNSSILNLNVPLPNSGYASAVGSNQGWHYGYFEIRAKWMSQTNGSWPALWMIPVGTTTSSHTAGGGEIDILEGAGGTQPYQVVGTVHEWSNGADVWNNESGGQNVYNATGVDLTQYHTYGLLWKPGSITWYFDNKPVITATAYPSTIDATSYYLILAQQVGANWTYGNMNGVTANDIQMNIDWVRVWQP
jgi:hypothetical protein